MKAARVALESTVISHGLPYPDNLNLAHEMETIVRQEGAQPSTIAIIEGVIRAGLTDAEIQLLATSTDITKVTIRNLPVVMAKKQHGATTVAATMWIARQAGIEVFATGGIGGVHRAPGGGLSADVSADLPELARTPVIVVCAGAKAVLDLPATREYLETHGVTVVGFGSDEMPAFYSRNSGLAVDVRCDTPEEIAELWRIRQELRLPGSLLVTVPIAEEAEIPAAFIEPFIEQALAEVEEQGLHSGEVTPFLLQRIGELSGRRSLDANLALLRNNARVAAHIARSLSDLLD